ncbi:hypothetical protein, partial [Candidatus Anaplasma sp. TIGMIC]|uniref:hypothetical protein n=1 Tax=Candidatus Anaplasma sp. TIGMIC TaxID=3020713 RepID=UPI00233120BA
MYIELMLNKREGINDVLNRKDRYAGNDRVFLSLKDLFQSTMKADVTFRSQPYSSHLQCAYMASAKLFDRARLKKALHEGAIDHPEYIVECYKIYGSLCMAIQDSGHDDEKYRIMQRAIISAVEAINILQNSTSNTAADEVSQQCASAIDCAQRAARIMGYISILPGEWNEFRDIDNAIRNSLKGALILSKMISPRTPPRLRVDAVSGTLYYMKDVLSKIKWYKTHETFTPFPHMVVMEAVAKFYINAIEHYADMREYKALEERPGLTDAHLLTSINIFEGMLIAKEARQKLISFGYASKTPECRGFKQIEDTLNTAYTKFCLEGMRRTHLGYINIQLRTLLYQTQKKTKELAKASWDQT